MEKRERDIESGLRKQVERMGGKFMKFTSPGNDGVPDRIAILPGGRVWFVELKREGEKPTAVQKWQLEQLRKIGLQRGADHRQAGGHRLVHGPMG